MATQLDLTDEILDRQTLSTVIDSDDVEAEREEAQLAAAIARKAKTPEDILVDEDPKNLPYDWTTVIWIGVVHVCALAAQFLFTWKALGLFAFLCWLTGSIGVCMGYHRQLTHGAFSTFRPIRWLLALLGGLSGEGSALTWVANHRKHHLYSDKDGDPHSPRRGAWWSCVRRSANVPKPRAAASSTSRATRSMRW